MVTTGAAIAVAKAYRERVARIIISFRHALGASRNLNEACDGLID